MLFPYGSLISGFSRSKQPHLTFFLWNIIKFMENFVKEKLLGKGCFGVVYLVRRKLDQQLYALKQVRPRSFRSQSAHLTNPKRTVL